MQGVKTLTSVLYVLYELSSFSDLKNVLSDRASTRACFQIVLRFCQASCSYKVVLVEKKAYTSKMIFKKVSVSNVKWFVIQKYLSPPIKFCSKSNYIFFVGFLM